ncbi:pentapeptide repeat-containing protein [Helicobacter sp. 10-6591]|uniref:pentapeptide repeat-containing protein n=1 Tax=Helicobacter sp. 10-6591 TaxID=2004998 RepID=UPI000DCDAED1|nr:pentapeptide repeat-containing protein [Helicobacter sp. 10-6591]RAX55622.1 hypothetical protein CCY97_03350 [Helicobacter sp. 10-6591]
MEYNEQLKDYGILATNTENKIEDNKIIIEFAQIDRIDLKRLQEKKIKEIRIYGSEIQYIDFTEDTTIDIDFGCCNFKNQVIARECNFNNTIAFTQCIFETKVDFSGATFNCQTTFLNSIFKAEARFIKTQFLAEQSDNNKIAENDFRETIFEGNASFDNAEFKGRVDFRISRFKAEARFIETKFSAEQGNGEIIENNFRQSIFEGNAYFNNIAFQGRVSFKFSSFMKETLFIDTNTQNCIFDYTEFNKTKFIKKDYKNAETYTFKNSTFKDTLSFENTNINKLEFDNVVFNGIVTFNEANFSNKPSFTNNKTNSNKPSFTNCTFSNQFNIEHEHIQYRYEDIEKIIEEKIERIEKYKSLLNYRDLFRKLKSNRIAHHNLIDASELHSQELYARELELKYKDKKTIKEHIEKWQLWFYYKLCDHHTDLVLNLKWLVYTIALYVLLLGKIPCVYPVAIPVFCVYVYMRGFKNVWLTVSLAIVFITILDTPKIILGISNLFEKDLNPWQNFITTLYVIAIGLVLFSLQKTARKNSIVPN